MSSFKRSFLLGFVVSAALCACGDDAPPRRDGGGAVDAGLDAGRDVDAGETWTRAAMSTRARSSMTAGASI
jgi:hypothetical protein